MILSLTVSPATATTAEVAVNAELPRLAAPELPILSDNSSRNFALQLPGCADLKQRLKKLADGQHVACLTRRPATQVDPHTITNLKKRVAASQISPPPDWCWDYRNQGVLGTRTSGCSYFDNSLQVLDNRTVVTGGLTFIELEYFYVSQSFPTYEQNTLITPTTPAWGTAVGTTVEGAAKCNSGTCTLISSYFPRQPFDNPSHIGEGQGIFVTTVAPGSGAVGYPFHQIDFRFSGPQYGSSVNTGGFWWGSVRCDNQTPGLSNVGCINHRIPAFHTASLSGTRSEYAGHIQKAQQSGLPGAFGSTPLRRLVNPAEQEMNYNKACPRSYTRPSGKQCDEYPFKTTKQGAFSGGGAGRTFTGCSIPQLPTGVTGPSGYSACMIAASHNGGGGVDLGIFYQHYRYIDDDPFYVNITP